jgi:hypothetical protein
MSFKDYIMYTPPGGGVYVPEAVFNWGFNISARANASANKGWKITTDHASAMDLSGTVRQNASGKRAEAA